jgi:hypothetical protein
MCTVRRPLSILPPVTVTAHRTVAEAPRAEIVAGEREPGTVEHVAARL